LVRGKESGRFEAIRLLPVVSLLGLGGCVLLGVFIWLGMKAFHEVVQNVDISEL
jgi:hypothetical protein